MNDQQTLVEWLRNRRWIIIHQDANSTLELVAAELLATFSVDAHLRERLATERRAAKETIDELREAFRLESVARLEAEIAQDELLDEHERRRPADDKSRESFAWGTIVSAAMDYDDVLEING